MGIMFLVFVPAPYVDASSAWSLPSKWQRVFVGAGGMIFELFVAAICAFIWKYTDPTHIVSKLAYNTMFIAVLSTLIVIFDSVKDEMTIVTPVRPAPGVSAKAAYARAADRLNLVFTYSRLALPLCVALRFAAGVDCVGWAA